MRVDDKRKLSLLTVRGRLFGLQSSLMSIAPGRRIAVHRFDRDQASFGFVSIPFHMAIVVQTLSVAEATQAEEFASEKLPTVMTFEARGL